MRMLRMMKLLFFLNVNRTYCDSSNAVPENAEVHHHSIDLSPPPPCSLSNCRNFCFLQICRKFSQEAERAGGATDSDQAAHATLRLVVCCRIPARLALPNGFLMPGACNFYLIIDAESKLTFLKCPAFRYPVEHYRWTGGDEIFVFLIIRLILTLYY